TETQSARPLQQEAASNSMSNESHTPKYQAANQNGSNAAQHERPKPRAALSREMLGQSDPLFDGQLPHAVLVANPSGLNLPTNTTKDAEAKSRTDNHHQKQNDVANSHGVERPNARPEWRRAEGVGMQTGRANPRPLQGDS